MAAYRSGERLTDERTGELKHYKREVQPETAIIAPAQSPDWVYDRNRLWNEVEKAEKRKDSQLCREINVALPVELTKEQQQILVAEYCQTEFVNRGMIADMAIHRDDPSNPHAHIMLTMREITPDGFGKKERSWNPDFANTKESTLGYVKDAEKLVDWRAAWSEHANRALQEAEKSDRIDHRSFKEQGIEDRLPTIHEGPTVREMEKRGEITDRGTINRTVRAHNSMVIDLQTYAQERQKIMDEMSRINAKPKSLKQIDTEHSRLYADRRDVSGEIHKLQTQLQQIENIQRLEKEHAALRKQQDELRPKNLWQRLSKPNQHRIDALERDIQRVEMIMQGEKRNTPMASEAPNIEKRISALQGTFKAVDRAFKAIDQERKQLLQEDFKRRMREQAKLQERYTDREWER